MGKITVCPRDKDPEPTFNWVFDYKPISPYLFTKPSCYKRTYSNLLADEKGPNQWNQLVVWVIHLYLYIYSQDQIFIKKNFIVTIYYL